MKEKISMMSANKDTDVGQKHGCQPPRFRTLHVSGDPHFLLKVLSIVGGDEGQNMCTIIFLFSGKRGREGRKTIFGLQNGCNFMI